VGAAAGVKHNSRVAATPAAVISGESAGCAAAQFLAGDSGALRGFEEEMREQFGPSLARALERRRSLSTCWHTAAAGRDEVMRRGWIGFGEYYMQTED
jgi:digeranylgeranylglycerophospholipid reductase